MTDIVSWHDSGFKGLTLAIATAQSVLREKADGVWGPVSAKSFANASPADKVLIRDLLDRAYSEAYSEGYVDVRDDGRMYGFYQYYAPSGIRSRVREELTPLPFSFVHKVIETESAGNFLATSRTGYVGLFQLGKAAMTDVYTAGLGRSTLTWRKKGEWWTLADWYDPMQNFDCGVLYLDLLRRRHRISTFPFLYAVFNLGYSAAKEVFEGGKLSTTSQAALRANSGIGATPSAYVAKVSRVFSGGAISV